ncbi:MAG: carboxyltransferase domain-containing protein [Sandaracinus sp.]
MTALPLQPVGDRAARLTIPAGVSRAALLDWLLAQPGVRDASLAAEHALIVVDGTPPAQLVLPALDAIPAPLGREHRVEVVYDGDDLDEVAVLAGLASREEVIARHVARPLEVSFLGFCPGFAYLVGLDEALAAVPRRSDPRVRVPPGSVAIAGGYGGIYPAALPGGWRLLGRAVGLDLLARERPHFAVGDRVRFVPV